MLVSSRTHLLSVSQLVRCSRGYPLHSAPRGSRYSSSSAVLTRTLRSNILISLGLFASGSLLGAYLFWPDASRSAPTYEDALLSPKHFTPATVIASEACPDPNTRLITLAVPPHLIPPRGETPFSPIWSIFIKDDDIQVERPYTPLEGIDEYGHMKFWIKRYPKGEVGRWLLSKNPGDSIEIRGPINTWPWKEDTWDEVVMISGGTGITPFYQLLNTIVKEVSNLPKAKFTLLHSSRTPASLPPPEMLNSLMKASSLTPGKFSMTLCVDELDGSSHPSVSSSDLHVGRISRASIERSLGLENRDWWRSLLRLDRRSHQEQSKKVLFLVCGPDAMISSIAGPWGRNFSQGEVGGILGTMGYTREQVRKL
ncbi:hypothetical protein CERSUDRAFT_149266 [Gelatoporia subvermispora B]|uniref:FAD-binding FR-type domain-containing protein n=1 Tax=Ceriporiopsis subvermispora (strain B) TaxID=914234 RepID=M2RPK9_CERS8|nr:hypothetical protein CERSUDRAFT_149266 [Gelatoporia subvermispora B]